MSETVQTDLGDQDLDAVRQHIAATPELQNTKPEQSAVSDFAARKHRECWCAECGCRVTVAPDCSVEFGHDQQHCSRALDREAGQ